MKFCNWKEKVKAKNNIHTIPLSTIYPNNIIYSIIQESVTKL